MTKKNIFVWILASIFLFVSLVLLFFVISNTLNRSNPQTQQGEQAYVDPILIDQDHYADALEKMDKELCNKINDQRIKDVCFLELDETEIYNLALDKFDTDICLQITNNEKRDACLRVVQQGVNHFGETDPAYLADIFIESHNEKAIAEIEKVIEKEDNAAVYASLALVYAEKALKDQERGDGQDEYVAKAFEAIEKAKTLEADNPEYNRIEAYINEIKPDYAKALELYNKTIDLDSENLLALIGRGHVHNMMGLLDKALEDFQTAAELDKKNEISAIYSHLCRLQATDSKLYEEALKNCNKVVEMTNSDFADLSQAYQIIASINMKKGDLDIAREALQEAMTVMPSDSNLYVTMARLYLIEENPDEVFKMISKSMELTPTKAISYKILAKHYYQLGDMNESIETSNKGLDLIDTDVSLLLPNKDSLRQDFYYLLADAYRMSEDTENEMKYKDLGDQFKIINVEE